MFSALATKLTNTELKDIGKTNLKEKVCYKATKLIGALFLQVKWPEYETSSIISKLLQLQKTIRKCVTQSNITRRHKMKNITMD